MRGTKAAIIVQDAFRELMDASSEEERNRAAEDLRIGLKRLLIEPMAEPISKVAVPKEARELLKKTGRVLRTVSDRQLEDFNRLLPWGAITPDERGRLVGRPWASHKRIDAAELVDKRLLQFDAVYPLADKHVLEFGCFEGMHTLGALLLGAKVTAADSRMENIAKTLLRLWIYGRRAQVVLWDLEEKAPVTAPKQWDYLHHVGVLYHLTNPLEHLQEVLPMTQEAVLLDTHVAQDAQTTSGAYATGERFYVFDERPKAGPFAGMKDHAKWLLLEDLIAVFRKQGFQDVRTISDRQERNGRRVTLFAGR